MDDAIVWMIRISGYGTFEFTGNEQQAEEMRSHKANWERGLGMKWRKDLSRPSDQLASEIAVLFDQGKGVSSGTIKRRSELLKLEAAP